MSWTNRQTNFDQTQRQTNQRFTHHLLTAMMDRASHACLSSVRTGLGGMRRAEARLELSLLLDPYWVGRFAAFEFNLWM